MKKSAYITITILVCIVLLAMSVFLFTNTYAIWVENEDGSMFIKVSILDENPSLKYQMFVPLEATNQEASDLVSAYRVIGGTYNISNGKYTYTLTNASDASKIVGFAVAGWFGGVQLEYIEVPASVTYSISAGTISFFGASDAYNSNVVRVMALQSMADYKIAGDMVLEKIVIGANVAEIDKSVCSGMGNLKTVEFKESATGIYVRPYAFAGCVYLTNQIINREIISDISTIFAK